MERTVCPVDVISVCSASGEIRPLRIRMEDEDRQLLRINVEEVLSVQDIQHVGAEAQIFRCRATVWGQNWIFDLKYHIRAHSWCMMRTQ